MRKTTISIVCCLALFAVPVKAEMEEGDIVVVTKPTAELLIESRPVGTVPAGQELRIRKVNGQWLWTSVELGGKTLRGWIARDAVKFVRKADPVTEGPGTVGAKQPKAPANDPMAEKKATDASDTIRKTLKAYAEAFNKNDAKTTAAFWSPRGVHIDRDTGDRTEGREAIEADFAKLFKEHRGTRLTASVTSVRFIKPDVAMVEGAATVFRPGDDPNESSFAAVLIKEEAGWLIDNVQETDTPTPTTPADALKDLEFLVGKWHDKTDGINVDTSVRWSANKAFLIRSYSVERAKEEEHEGTQVIGWDPRAKRIRSWTFDSDGSFGEESWTKVDGDWVIKMSRTLADGGTSSGTQVISIKDHDTLTVQVVSRDVDGEPEPGGDPVTVVRVAKGTEKIGASETSKRGIAERIEVEKVVIEEAPATAPRQ